MTSYFNQTQLAEEFGLSFEEMDKILIEHGLKSGELATQMAIDDGYAVAGQFPAPAPLNYWNPIKVSELTGKKLQDEIGFYASGVLLNIQFADEQQDPSFILMLATHAYDDVPESLRKDVQKRIDRELIGDRRKACEKCGRLTLYINKGVCWRCRPKDKFLQLRIDCESAVRKAAERMAARGCGTFHKDHNLEPRDTDIELWNGAIDTAIDAFIGGLINPSKCPKHQYQEIIDELTDTQPFCEFVYSGYEDHGCLRCEAFLKLAYKTVADVLEKRVRQMKRRSQYSTKS